MHDEPSLQEMMDRLRRTQYAKYIEKYGDEHLPLYHGTRRKESAKKLETKGFCTFASSEEAIDHIRKALQLIKSEKYLLGQGRKARCNLIESIVHEISDTPRRKLYMSTDEKIACQWAGNNPEIVSEALRCAQPYKFQHIKNRHKLQKILTKLYGNPYVVKLRATHPFETTNINSGKSCFTPEDIEWVKPCPKD